MCSLDAPAAKAIARKVMRDLPRERRLTQAIWEIAVLPSSGDEARRLVKQRSDVKTGIAVLSAVSRWARGTTPTTVP